MLLRVFWFCEMFWRRLGLKRWGGNWDDVSFYFCFIVFCMLLRLCFGVFLWLFFVCCWCGVSWVIWDVCVEKYEKNVWFVYVIDIIVCVWCWCVCVVLYECMSVLLNVLFVLWCWKVFVCDCCGVVCVVCDNDDCVCLECFFFVGRWKFVFYNNYWKMWVLYVYVLVMMMDEFVFVGLLDMLDMFVMFEYVVDDVKVKKEVSEFVGLSAMDEAFELGIVLRVCDVIDLCMILFVLWIDFFNCCVWMCCFVIVIGFFEVSSIAARYVATVFSAAVLDFCSLDFWDLYFCIVELCVCCVVLILFDRVLCLFIVFVSVVLSFVRVFDNFVARSRIRINVLFLVCSFFNVVLVFIYFLCEVFLIFFVGCMSFVWRFEFESLVFSRIWRIDLILYSAEWISLFNFLCLIMSLLCCCFMMV